MNVQPATVTLTKLFTSGLSPEADEDSIAKHIERIDKTIKVKNITVIRDYQTFKSKGLAIIEFANTEDCKRIK